MRLPQAFLPEEDQGDFMIMVMQPEGTPMAETMANVGDVERYLAEHEPVPTPMRSAASACTATAPARR